MRSQMHKIMATILSIIILNFSFIPYATSKSLCDGPAGGLLCGAEIGDGNGMTHFEKLLDVILTGGVPIYWGCKNIPNYLLKKKSHRSLRASSRACPTCAQRSSTYGAFPKAKGLQVRLRKLRIGCRLAKRARSSFCRSASSLLR